MSIEDLTKLQVERQELKKQKSALESDLRKARNAESDARKALEKAQAKLSQVDDLKNDVSNRDNRIAGLEARVVELEAQEARAASIIEDVKALARLVARA